MAHAYLGVDVGSISTKGVVVDENYNVLANVYLRTQGNPIEAIKELLRKLKLQLSANDGIEIRGAGTTGSARRLAGVMLQADIVKNEIIAHAIAACQFYPEAQTVIEIGVKTLRLLSCAMRYRLTSP